MNLKRKEPKYKLDDWVKFNTGKEILTGQIFVVDRFGIFGNKDIHYDIMVEERNTLYKHIHEEDVIGYDSEIPEQ